MKIKIQKLKPKIQIILQYMISNHKSRSIMIYNIYSLIYIENKLILVYLNLQHLKLFITI